jgi:hypothetical protein
MNARVLVRGRGSRLAGGRAFGSALLLAAILGACASDQHPVILIDNQLAIPVTVVFQDEAGAESDVVETVPADSEYPVSIFRTDRCTPGVLIARDKATGVEVARSQGPVCRPSRFVIVAPPSSS